MTKANGHGRGRAVLAGLFKCTVLTRPVYMHRVHVNYPAPPGLEITRRGHVVIYERYVVGLRVCYLLGEVLGGLFERPIED